MSRASSIPPPSTSTTLASAPSPTSKKPPSSPSSPITNGKPPPAPEAKLKPVSEHEKERAPEPEPEQTPESETVKPVAVESKTEGKMRATSPFPESAPVVVGQSFAAAVVVPDGLSAKQEATVNVVEDVEVEEVDETRPIVDMETFEQILELDEDDTRDFSVEMVWQYFEQAGRTCGELKDAFDEKNLRRLSELGHFLKGSSAALGVTRVQNTCERIQHYGKLWDDELSRDLTPEDAMRMIKPLLSRVQREYSQAESWLKGWYAKQGITGPPS